MCAMPYRPTTSTMSKLISLHYAFKESGAMLPLRKKTQLLISTAKFLAVTTLLIVVGLLLTLDLILPVRAGASIQSIKPDTGTHQGMMESTSTITATMSMAEMGAMMDQ